MREERAATRPLDMRLVNKDKITGPLFLAESYAMSSTELRELITVIEENKDAIERYWYEHFNI